MLPIPCCLPPSLPFSQGAGARVCRQMPCYTPPHTSRTVPKSSSLGPTRGANPGYLETATRTPPSVKGSRETDKLNGTRGWMGTGTRTPNAHASAQFAWMLHSSVKYSPAKVQQETQRWPPRTGVLSGGPPFVQQASNMQRLYHQSCRAQVLHGPGGWHTLQVPRSACPISCPPCDIGPVSPPTYKSPHTASEARLHKARTCVQLEVTTGRPNSFSQLTSPPPSPVPLSPPPPLLLVAGSPLPIPKLDCLRPSIETLLGLPAISLRLKERKIHDALSVLKKREEELKRREEELRKRTEEVAARERQVQEREKAGACGLCGHPEPCRPLYPQSPAFRGSPTAPHCPGLGHGALATPYRDRCADAAEGYSPMLPLDTHCSPPAPGPPRVAHHTPTALREGDGRPATNSPTETSPGHPEDDPSLSPPLCEASNATHVSQVLHVSPSPPNPNPPPPFPPHGIPVWPSFSLTLAVRNGGTGGAIPPPPLHHPQTPRFPFTPTSPSQPTAEGSITTADNRRRSGGGGGWAQNSQCVKLEFTKENLDFWDINFWVPDPLAPPPPPSALLIHLCHLPITAPRVSQVLRFTEHPSAWDAGHDPAHEPAADAPPLLRPPLSCKATGPTGRSPYAPTQRRAKHASRIGTPTAASHTPPTDSLYKAFRVPR